MADVVSLPTVVREWGRMGCVGFGGPPGGRLVVVGLAREQSLLDFAYSLASIPLNRILIRRHDGQSAPPNMPTKDSPMTMSQVRQAAQSLLPGSRFERRLLWRYSLVWDKPTGL